MNWIDFETQSDDSESLNIIALLRRIRNAKNQVAF